MADIQQLNEQLEKKTQALSEVAEKLQKANRDLIEFTYMASHDLQEPIRAILLSLEVIEYKRKNHSEVTQEDYEECWKMVSESAHHCQNLIQELLQYSRSGTRPMEIKHFNFEEVSNRVIAGMKQEIDFNDAVISSDNLGIEIEADENKIEKVLQNLLINAIRYRGDHSPHINLSGAVLEKEWIFSIQDNGIGIAERYQETIFAPFKRLSRDVPGTGMGLAICKRLIERHGGRLWVESIPDRGSTFYFSLPRANGYRSSQ